MNHSNGNERYNRNIILASTLFGAALGYLLFRPRGANLLHDRNQSDVLQFQTDAKPPVLIAPLSLTIH